MHSLRSKALLAVAVAVALAHPAAGAPTVHASASALCATAVCPAETADVLRVSLPDGSQPCPESGVGASCLTSQGADATPGTASTPDGPEPVPCEHRAQHTSRACSDLIPASTVDGAPARNPSVQPSVPVSTIRPPASTSSVTLASSAPAAISGATVVLTATARALPDGGALQVFDTTTGTLVGSCSQGTHCAVGYSAEAGVHRFQAIVSGTPSEAMPSKSSAASDAVSVGWIGVSLATTQTAIGPGNSATLTATSTVPVEQFGYAIQLTDGDRMTPVTYCSRGTSCSVSVAESVSGSHSFAASVGPATSDHVAVTWLSLALTGSAAYRVGGLVHLDATANADLTKTRWSIGILDEHGHLVGPPCTAATTCSVDVRVTSTTPPVFTAVVGVIPPAQEEGKLAQIVQQVSGPATLTNIQAQSAPFQPARLLWGVDSCKAFTGDPTGEIYPGVAGGLGAPEFWGRYITRTMCPALSSAEVAMAHDVHMAILPIYNDYDCSNVAGFDTAVGYAQAAVAAAQNLQIPLGRGLAVDIEPPGPYCSGAVDAGFIRGWYAGVSAAGYVPIYYGNGTAGTEFAGAWCQAQSEQNEIAQGSFIWSFEPSLDSSGWSKANQPGWGPYATGCPGAVAAWQYQIDVFSPNPNIDSDEALSTLPLWYP